MSKAKSILDNISKRNTLDSPFGDWTRYSLQSVDSSGTELAVLAIVQVICLVGMMHRLNGRPWRAEAFFHYLPIDLLGTGYKSAGLVWYLRVVAWFYMALPFVTAVFWGLLVISEKQKDKPVEDQF